MPNTPTAPNAPNQDAGNKYAEESVSAGNVSRRQKGKKYAENEKIFCKGMGDKHCGKVVEENADGGIECEVCINWFHPGCQGLEENAYHAIRENNLFWICTMCKSKVPEFRALLHGDQSASKAMQIDQVCLTRMESKIDELSKVVREQHTLTKEIRAEEEEVRKTYADALKDSKAKPPEPLSTEIQKCLSEQAEQEKRVRNLAIYNLPESQAASAEERIKEDISLLTDIVKQELKRSYKIEKAYRAGKKLDNRPRTLIVTMENEASKWDLLKAGNGLRESRDDVARNVYINRDLTQREREQAKQVRDECRRRRDAGENVRIYKGKCVADTRKNRGAQRDQPAVDEGTRVPLSTEN